MGLRIEFGLARSYPFPSLKGMEIVAALLPFGKIVACVPDILETAPDASDTQYTIRLEPRESGAAGAILALLQGDPELTGLRVAEAAEDDPASRQAPDVQIRSDRLAFLERQAAEMVAALGRLGTMMARLEPGREADAAGVARLVQQSLQAQRALAPLAQQICDSTRRLMLVPASTLLGRLSRPVRDLARELGKQVRLTIEGEETEFEQGVLEELREPLLHLVRNSVGHGIEPPAEREAGGKPPVGSIRVSAYTAGDNAVIEVRDDGRGIDSEKIGNRAVLTGLATSEMVAALTDEEIFNFIYLPGFTTAESVSTLSGRGIGMDVVKSRVAKLHGTIEASGGPGRGAAFTIRIPLAASLIRALVVQTAGRRVAIPASAIRSIGLASDWTGARTRGTHIVPLSRALGWGEHPTPRIVEIGVAERRIGLGVEACLDHEELALRPLGSYLGHVPAISGAALLASGEPVLVLDTAELAGEVGL